MIDENTLKEYEPRLYRLFYNSSKYNRVANAYLLYGERNSPLKETSIYLAKSLSCATNYFACDKCNSCMRFNKGIRPDFLLIDGNKDTIKKDDILLLESKFSSSALEKNHRMTYVINMIENITNEAANSLLKFLEEPKENQVGFLTTTNLARVLPTIHSRCLSIRLDPINPDAVYNQLLETEMVIASKSSSTNKRSSKTKVNKKEEKKEIATSNTRILPAGACYVLSKLFSSVDECKELLETDSTFLEAYNICEQFLNELVLNYKHASYYLLNQTSQITSSSCYNWLFLILSELFTESLDKNINDINPFRDILIKLSKSPTRISKCEEVIKEAIALRQINLSPTLTVVRIILALDEAN